MNTPQRPDADQGGSHRPKYADMGETKSQMKTSDKTDHSNKKRQERVYGGELDQPDNDSEDNDSEDSETDNDAVPRYPYQVNSPRQVFACPFAKYDPRRYADCRQCRLARISDVSHHIKRSHVLRDYVPESRTTIASNNICVYCIWCRGEFRGVGAEKRLHDHKMGCQARKRPATIERTGVLAPKEFDDLRSALVVASGNIAKWNIIWYKCFPATPAPLPYVELAVSQPEAQQILQQLLASSAANPWSSVETKQCVIDEALGALYFGMPFPEIEPRINDASTILSTDLSTFDDPNDGYSTVPESYGDLGDMDQWTRPLKTAIADVDHGRVHYILRNSFDKVTVGQYSWLLELKALGLSMDEIAGELLERAQHGPWIYSKIDVHDVGSYVHDFHIPRCLHTSREDETIGAISLRSSQSLMSIETDIDNSIRETIDYWCGIGGVSPMPDGSHNLQFGSVDFENANSTAVVSLMTSQSAQAAQHVLQHLYKAIGALQEVCGCCDSFSFLARQESFVELERIYPDLTSEPGPLVSLTNSKATIEDLNQQLRDSLTAQFLSLAFALYAQGHCEPFEPFFLDTPLKRILLLGNQIWGSSFTGPCILATPVDLSCMGEMVQRRVFAFKYFDSFERSNVFSHCEGKFHLKAYPEDLLDTWGPGNFIMPKK